MNDEIKKPRYFLPKMFKVFTLYIIVTLSVFFGYVELFGDVPPIINDLTQDSADAEDDTPFSAFLVSLGNFQNVHAENINLSFENRDMALNLVGDATFDAQSGAFAFDFDVVYNENVFDIGAVYTNSNLYLTLENSTYKFDTNLSSDDQTVSVQSTDAQTEGAQSFDFSKILQFISQNVNIDLSFLNDIGSALGIDFENFDIANLQSMLNTEDSKELEDGRIELIVRLGNALSAQIMCDESYNVTSAKLRDNIVIKGNAISFNAPNVAMNAQDVANRIVEPSVEDIIDMSAATKFVGYAKNLFTNSQIGMDVEVGVNGQSYAVNLLIDQEETFKVQAQTNIEGIDVSIIYADETIYLDAEGVKLAFTLADYQKWEEQINILLEKFVGKDARALVKELTEKFVDLDQNNLQDKILNMFEETFKNSEKINSYLPDSTVETDKTFAMLWENGLEIRLTQNEDMLSEILAKLDQTTLKINFFASENIVSLSGNYFDLSGMLSFVQQISEMAVNERGAFDVSIDYNGFDISGVVKYNDNIWEFSDIDIAGEKLSIRLQNNIVYITYGNMKLKYPMLVSGGNANAGDWKMVVNKLINDEFGVDIQFGVFEEVLYMLRDYSTLDYINNLYFTSDAGEDCFKINVSKTGQESSIAEISFNFDASSEIVVDVYDKASITLAIKENATPISIDFDDSDYSTDFVEGLLDSAEFEKDVYAFASDLAIRYSTNTFYGDLVAMLVKGEDGYTPAISVHTTALGFSTYIYMIGNAAYIDFHGLQIKVDLRTSTILDVMNFVEEKFGIALSSDTLKKTQEAFKVILPAIDQIYGSWVEYVDEKTYNGLQFTFQDKLQYTQNAAFHDIIIRGFLENYENTIVPTKIVIGANIEDENTALPDKVDKFKDSWMTCEEDATKQLNFAVYLTNVSVGRYVESLRDIFGQDLKNVETVKSNYTNTNLADFNHYKTVLDLVETVYDYGTALHYDVNLHATIDSVDQSNAKQTELSGGVLVAVDDLAKESTEDREGIFAMFNGKSLTVQGNALDIKYKEKAQGATEYTLTQEHIIDLLYGSGTEGLYVTYTHDNLADGKTQTNNIGKNYLRGKIENANMSDIISMALGFAGVELSPKMMEAWNLKQSTTDFEFLRSLLKMEKQDTSDTVSKVDGILSSITEMSQMLTKLKLEKVKNAQSLFDTVLSLQIDMAKLNESETAQIATVKIVLSEENSDEKVTKSLRKIVVENLIFGGSVINCEIDFNDYDFSLVTYDQDENGNKFVSEDNNFDYLDRNPANTHIDFSEISSFVDAGVKTINTKGFNFSGETSISIDIGIEFDAVKVGYDVFASIDDNGEIYLYVELDVGCILVATYDSGFMGHTYTTDWSFDKRISTLEFKDGVLTITQNTHKDKTLLSSEKNKTFTWTYTADQIGENIMLIMTQAIGLTDKISNAILSLITKMDPSPSFEQTVLGFTVNRNANNDITGYVLSLDGETLTGDNNFGDMDVVLGLTEKGKYEGGKQFIDSINTTINIANGTVKIPLNLGSVNNKESYTTAANKTIFTNDTYRRKYIYKIHTLQFEENGGQLVEDLIESAGTEIQLKSLPDKIIDDKEAGIKQTFVFEGWYTTSTFDEGTQFTSDVMPNKDTILYAKWVLLKTEHYRTISFVADGDLVFDPITQLEGTELTLPTVPSTTRVTAFEDENGNGIKTEEFAGWFDEEGNEFASSKMPETDLVLHIKWAEIDKKYYRTISFESEYGYVFDDITLFEGSSLTLPEIVETKEVVVEQEGVSKEISHYQFVGWFDEEDNAFSETTMPQKNVKLTAKWQQLDHHIYYAVNIYHNNELVERMFKENGQTASLDEIKNLEAVKAQLSSHGCEFYYQENDASFVGSVTIQDAALNVYFKNYYTLKFNTDASMPRGDAANIVFPVNDDRLLGDGIVLLEGTMIKASDYCSKPNWIYKSAGLWYYHVFQGWTLTKDGDGNTNLQFALSGDTQIYAKWKDPLKVGTIKKPDPNKI